MMDIYEYLKRDHENVNKLFEQFKKSKRTDRQVQIIIFLTEQLLVHAKSEQETFYNVLEQKSDSNAEIIHGIKEHKEIEDQIKLILDSEKPDAKWRKKVEILQELVSHHVNEEEGRIFKKAKKILSQEEANVIKEQMHELKQFLLRRLEKVSSTDYPDRD